MTLRRHTTNGHTLVRGRIFVTYPKSEADQVACAEQILSRLARLAYRREVTQSDMNRLCVSLQSGSSEAGVDAGIESGLGAMLVSPQLSFFVSNVTSNMHRAVKRMKAFIRSTIMSLATRLAFFL